MHADTATRHKTKECQPQAIIAQWLENIPGRQKHKGRRKHHDISHVFRTRCTDIDTIVEKAPDGHER